eukprot:1055382-Pelagomonas_calceolata.AAC.1
MTEVGDRPLHELDVFEGTPVNAVHSACMVHAALEDALFTLHVNVCPSKKPQGHLLKEVGKKAPRAKSLDCGQIPSRYGLIVEGIAVPKMQNVHRCQQLELLWPVEDSTAQQIVPGRVKGQRFLDDALSTELGPFS